MDYPVFVFDDDCGFCTWWAEAFEDHANLRTVGFSELGPELRERLPDDYRGCSHLVTERGVYSCGASTEEALLRAGPGSFARPLVEHLREFEVYRRLREWGYRQGANNRVLWGRVLSRTPPARTANETETDDE